MECSWETSPSSVDSSDTSILWGAGICDDIVSIVNYYSFTTEKALMFPNSELSSLKRSLKIIDFTPLPFMTFSIAFIAI